MKLFAIIFLITICICSASCHFGGNATLKNEQIDKGVKNEIANLNTKLFKAIAEKDGDAIKDLMSPKLAEKSGRSLDTLTSTFADTFNAASYSVLDEYYTKNATANITDTVVSANGTNKGYTINFTTLNEETYVSVLVSKSFPVSVMVLAIYGKYDDEWKLNILHFGEYAVLDKTAPEYYNTASNLDNKGDIIDAVNLILTASQLTNPGGTYFKYKSEAAINALYTKVLKEADDKFLFPIDVTQVKTKPQIFAVTPQLINSGKSKGIFPIIKYASSIKLSDTTALKAENIAVQKSIGSLFKDIDADNSEIIYQVFDKIPDGKTQVKRYDFFQKTNNR
jgi:hypothetical protein